MLPRNVQNLMSVHKFWDLTESIFDCGSSLSGAVSSSTDFFFLEYHMMPPIIPRIRMRPPSSSRIITVWPDLENAFFRCSIDTRTSYLSWPFVSYTLLNCLLSCSRAFLARSSAYCFIRFSYSSFFLLASSSCCFVGLYFLSGGMYSPLSLSSNLECFPIVKLESSALFFNS